GFTGNIRLAGPVDLTAGASTVPTLHLRTGGAILDGTSGERTLTVGSLAVEAATGIGSTDLDVAVSNLAASAGSAGPLRRTTGSLTVSSVDGVDGLTAGGNLSLTVTGGSDDLTVAAGKVVRSTGGSVTLQAGGLLGVPAGASVQAAGPVLLAGGLGE